MRDPQRINRITDALNHLWHIAPDQRLGQLIYNVVPAGKWDAMYEVEEGTWLRWIEQLIEEWSK